MRMLYRLRLNNQRWRTYSPMLVQENRWRAMRYSYDEGLIDFARGEIVPFEHLLDEILELTYEDASELGCASEVAAVRDILSRGTSSHRQLKARELALAAGKTPEEALQAVVDTLVADTAESL
jgi:carboxylate-amine ligase